MRVAVIKTVNGLPPTHAVVTMRDLSNVSLLTVIGHTRPLCQMDRINRDGEAEGIVYVSIAEDKPWTYTEYAFVVAPLS